MVHASRIFGNAVSGAAVVDVSQSRGAENAERDAQKREPTVDTSAFRIKYFPLSLSFSLD